MWVWFALCLGLVAGAGIGYKHTSKKATSLIKFVPKSDEDKVLKELHIQIGNDAVCSICAERITKDNLGAILKTRNGNIFFCSRSQCMTIASISPHGKEKLITRKTF